MSKHLSLRVEYSLHNKTEAQRSKAGIDAMRAAKFLERTLGGETIRLCDSNKAIFKEVGLGRCYWHRNAPSELSLPTSAVSSGSKCTRKDRTTGHRTFCRKNYQYQGVVYA
ncbi:hypothetical protein [Pseudooceanicola batsensis]|uniref:hypothetical protein n=1 Tax=Pseudooceanicola batsensis TaxID=314255 RepID=UPI0003249595|nr:hypothetical protein [Pseudooceanicola batsensis]